MTRLAFFGHDVADSAIRRRVQSFREDGLDVRGFMMRRDREITPEWETVDLGQTFDGQFLQRFRSIFRGAKIAASPDNRLAEADIIYARNLDMLACAFLAKRKAGLDTPVIYESLDVHRLLVRRDPIGWSLRGLERALLKRSKALIVSSPAFLKHHFDRYYAGLFNPVLVENRLSVSAIKTPRPEHQTKHKSGPLVIGWVGILRCQRSFDLLLQVADQFGADVDIRLHGKPSRTEVPVFEPEIEKRSNVTYFGSYQAPEGLDAVYRDLDVVWAGDFMEAGYNSVWLLPNRLYEGGYFATPPITVAETETARWADDKAVGLTAQEPLETDLPRLIGRLIEERSIIYARRSALLDLSEDVFIQPKGVFADLVASVLSDVPKTEREETGKELAA